MSNLNNIVENNAKALRAKKNVNAIAIGKKWVDDKPTD